MIKNKLLILLFLFSFIFSNKFYEAVEWEVKLDRKDIYSDEFFLVDIKFNIDSLFHIYSADTLFSPPYGNTNFYLADSQLYQYNSNLYVPEQKKKFDNSFGKIIGYYKGEFVLSQIVQLDKIDSGEYKDTIYLDAIACDPSMCISISDKRVIEFNVIDTTPRLENINNTRFVNIIESRNAKSLIDRLLSFLSESFEFCLAALGAGFIALFTPCVFPMIPITVSFFTKQGEKNNRKNQIFMAAVYAISIIVIFTLLGLLLALFIGASGARLLGSDPYVNLFIGILFIVLAFSLFGFYELDVPSSFKQFSLKNESAGGIVGIFFMALTFTLTAFTCTVPFVGGLLMLSTQGDLFYPIIGMIIFSGVLAAPFFFLALFPQYLAKLPKSGGWLNSVKVIMGFLEIAAAMKFIGTTDMQWRWDIFSREVILIIWVILFVLKAVYILGFIKFPHDSTLNKRTLRRYGLSMIFIIVALWLGTGITGYKVYSPGPFRMVGSFIESWMPIKEHYIPKGEGVLTVIDFSDNQNFELSNISLKGPDMKEISKLDCSLELRDNGIIYYRSNKDIFIFNFTIKANDDANILNVIEGVSGGEVEENKFNLDFIENLGGVDFYGYYKWIESYETAHLLAEHKNKPLFLDFTGYACTNCRYMELDVFHDERVQEIFNKSFVTAKLYTDNRSKNSNTIYREILNNPLNYNTDAVPYYSIVDPSDIQISVWDNKKNKDSSLMIPEILPSNVISDYNGYNPDVQKFIDYLNDGLKKFNDRKRKTND